LLALKLVIGFVSPSGQAAARSTTPCGTSPVVTIRHKAMSSFRPGATIRTVLHALHLGAGTIRLRQRAVLLEQQEPPGQLDRPMAHPGIARLGQALFPPKLDFPQFLSCAGLCGGPEDVLGGDELEGAIDR